MVHLTNLDCAFTKISRSVRHLCICLVLLYNISLDSEYFVLFPWLYILDLDANSILFYFHGQVKLTAQYTSINHDYDLCESQICRAKLDMLFLHCITTNHDLKYCSKLGFQFPVETIWYRWHSEYTDLWCQNQGGREARKREDEGNVSISDPSRKSCHERSGHLLKLHSSCSSKLHWWSLAIHHQSIDAKQF